MRTVMLLVLLIQGGVACNKMTPQLRQTATQDATVADAAKNGSRTGKGSCFPGQALETSGEFYWPIDSTLPNYAQVVVFMGNGPNGQYNLDELRDRKRRGLAGTCDLEFYTQNLQYFVTASIKDLYGNLMVQIQDNKWKVFRNAILKYNYDSLGFELYDKAGRIALSIDVRKFGIGPAVYSSVISPCTDTTLSYYAPTDFYYRILYGTRELNRAFDQLYRSDPIPPLFRYTGKDWQHARL
ncbi:hypothetical protein ACQ86N_21605 [Puia sp. P3]|uniref:hypothetical protein n=1 Tax=Puia sp. P3 TaxID=3423952 RepID=UPI003D665262